jgi:tetratricopeptide (TPR) repeat protein
LEVNLSLGFYQTRWGFLKCNGTCAICSAAWELAESGASLTIAPGNIAGETACPATIAVIRGHPNMNAYAAGLYPDSGVGTEVFPTTTMYEVEPVPGAGTEEAANALLARLRADPSQKALHLALLRVQKFLPIPVEVFYAELAAAHPTVAEVHFFWGNNLVLDGKDQEAEARLREAVRLNPKDPVAHQTLAVALGKQKKYREAEIELLDAIQLDRHSAESYYNLGVFYSDQGRKREAEKAYRKSVSLNRDFAEAHYNLAHVLDERGRDREAIEEYREAIRRKPNHASARYNLGRILARQQDLEGAAMEFRAAIAIDPGHAAWHSDLGVLMEQKGDPRQAATEYHEAIRCDPSFPEAHYNLANLYMDCRMYREAAQEYREALRCRPNYTSAQTSLAQALALQKQNPGG